MATDTPDTKTAPRRARGRPRKAALTDAADKRAPDYERLQNLLRDDILSGRLAAGSRLKVSDIALRFRTSTNPAREALRGLEGEGLVAIQANRGASIREIDESFVQNIFDIRRLIEPYIIRHFVECASPAEIDMLENFQAGCDAGEESGEYMLFHINNTAFHDLILERHFNTEAIKIMKQHSVWLRVLSRRHPLTLAHIRRSNREHREFIDAVQRGDPDRAVAVMERHLQNARRIFLADIREELSTAADSARDAPPRHPAHPARSPGRTRGGVTPVNRNFKNIT